MPDATCDIGLIGLAVMGQNLVLNMNDHGFKVAVFNRTVSKVDDFLANEAKGTQVVGAHSIEEFVGKLKSPRRVMLMVKAGDTVDQMIDHVLPFLSRGDIVIDGGNSLFTDSNRRTKDLAAKGILFIGTGVSGGEEGARFGPSIMPGGNPEAWPHVKEIFQSIAAKVDEGSGGNGKGGTPCCDWVGDAGAGHFVKMVHNGIEYGDMQLICEAYSILRYSLGKSPAEISTIMKEWNQGDLDSFLIEISADVLQQKDPVTGKPFVDVVLDSAGQKGTGKWTSVNALDLGIPAASVAEAVFARLISGQKDERVRASKILKGPTGLGKSIDITVDAVRDALYCSKLCCYAQGFELYAQASHEYKWNLNLAAIAQIFRGGCIIRARFLQKITDAFTANPKLDNLLVDPYFVDQVKKTQDNWRRVVARAALDGTPVPVFASALSYFDSYRAEVLPANLLQAQRDYFGAHTYERIDAPRGEFFHVDWPDPKRPQLKASELGMSR